MLSELDSSLKYENVGLQGEGQRIVASDVYKAVGYSRRAGVEAIQRLGDVEIDLQGVPKIYSSVNNGKGPDWDDIDCPWKMIIDPCERK